MPLVVERFDGQHAHHTARHLLANVVVTLDAVELARRLRFEELDLAVVLLKYSLASGMTKGVRNNSTPMPKMATGKPTLVRWKMDMVLQ